MSEPAAQLRYADIQPGDTFSFEQRFGRDEVLAFARLSGDYSPLHVDREYAATTEFGECVVHGMLLASLFSRLVGMHLPGTHALYLGQDLTFRRPVLVGESVRALAKVTAKSDATRTITLQTEIRGADDRVAVSGSARVKCRDPIDAAAAAAAPAARDPGAPASAGRRVALVTGGSRGIGAEIARTLAARGWAVAVGYHRNADAAAGVVAQIVGGGGSAAAFRVDVRDDDSIAALLGEVRERLGAPLLLVHCATGDLESRPVGDLRWSDFAHHLDHQVKAALALCQGVYPGMKEAGGGSIVNLLSQVTGNLPATRMADYVTAKYALMGLSKALAAEWADQNIRVNMVSPSLVRTELTQNVHDRVFKLEAARTPLKRLATPADVANAVAYLAADEAAFLTGVNLFVTGGQIML